MAVRAVGKLARAGFAVGGFGAPSGFDPGRCWRASRAGPPPITRSRTGATTRPPARRDGAKPPCRCVRRPARRARRRRARCRRRRSPRWRASRGGPGSTTVVGERAREDTRARLAEAFEALAARGGITTLTGVLGSISRSLVALSLRVAPPDPIDSGVPRGARAALAQVRGPVDAADARRRREPRADGHAACDDDALVRETLQLCQTLQLRGSPRV